MAKKKMYQRPDGLYEKKITIGDKRVTFRGKSEREVMQKMVEYNETQKELENPFFPDVAENWYQQQMERFEAGALSMNTVRGYSPAKKDCQRFFQSAKVKDLSPQDCNRYIRWLSIKNKNKKTVINKFSVFHCILDFACVTYNIAYNPAESVKIPDGLSRNYRKIPDEKHILDLQTKRPQQNTTAFWGWLICYTALYTGARRGEIIAMRFGTSGIDVKSNIIHIANSVYYDGNTPYLKSTKSASGMRDVVLLPELKATLLGIGFQNGKLLLDHNGHIMTSKRAERCLNAYYRWSGNHSTPHQYRHGFITICFEAGIEAKIVQEMAGHAQLSTTLDIYTHVRKKKLEEAAEKLKNIDFSTGTVTEVAQKA